MDPKELRRLVSEVDDDHRAAMRTFDRRHIVRAAGAGGAALVVGGVALTGLATAADAQTATTTAGGVTTTAGGVTTAAAATTTTTLPPQAPQPTDLPILAFAQSVELALVQLYMTALATQKLTADDTVTVTTFQSHHRQHGQSFAAQAGKAALNQPNQTLMAEFMPKVQAAATGADLLRHLYDLENAAATSYTAALANVLGTNPAGLMGSIQPIEARHAVVYGQALGLSTAVYVPAFEDTTGGFTPAEYPIVER